MKGKTITVKREKLDIGFALVCFGTAGFFLSASYVTFRAVTNVCGMPVLAWLCIIAPVLISALLIYWALTTKTIEFEEWEVVG